MRIRLKSLPKTRRKTLHPAKQVKREVEINSPKGSRTCFSREEGLRVFSEGGGKKGDY